MFDLVRHREPNFKLGRTRKEAQVKSPIHEKNAGKRTVILIESESRGKERKKEQ